MAEWPSVVPFHLLWKHSSLCFGEKVLFLFARLDTTLDRGFRRFFIKAHTKANPFCLQLRIVVSCKSVSVFSQFLGTLIFLPAFQPQTSSHAMRDYHCTCLRKKKKEKYYSDSYRAKIHSVDCLGSLENLTQFRVFLGQWFFYFGGGKCIDICSSAFILCLLLFPQRALRKKLRDVWREGWNFSVELT